jgi:hypothetical protein
VSSCALCEQLGPALTLILQGFPDAIVGTEFQTDDSVHLVGPGSENDGPSERRR